MSTSVPVEVILAAHRCPVDLNNVFINSPNPRALINEAEAMGFPRNMCAWIKGIYATAMAMEGLEAVISVIQGDCSNVLGLSEILGERGIRIIPFEYPPDRDKARLAWQMDKLAETLGAAPTDVIKVKSRLDSIRAKLIRLDELTWRENKVTGFENHMHLVSSSDFNCDPDTFEAELDDFLVQAMAREPLAHRVRLGYVGVPPIITGIYDYLEELGAAVVFNEVQRQFAMPPQSHDIIEQYLKFTYPYDLFGRVHDIGRAVAQRQIHGLIHYTQSFCYRQVHDIIFRERLDLPILTIEGDKFGPLDNRTKMRLEAFVDVLGDQ
ncbi:MAG: 2-hydroxyacyl-CoA dehydratase [Deltaproteobacteria bacterium]|nr:2-hydroxyacyl-CoA dehydratase [Deltaproteobacteria bacterium]